MLSVLAFEEGNSVIAKIIERSLAIRLKDAIAHTPAVALLGPRQAGKTTLALGVGRAFDALCISTSNPSRIAPSWRSPSFVWPTIRTGW